MQESDLCIVDKYLNASLWGGVSNSPRPVSCDEVAIF